ncbi:MAG: hypothetical protein JSR16_08590 [Proteobacteria bacterium]|nr:hypothetical protein [Pseudomonadota bacterium]
MTKTPDARKAQAFLSFLIGARGSEAQAVSFHQVVRDECGELLEWHRFLIQIRLQRAWTKRKKLSIKEQT